MIASDACRAIIKTFESCRLTAYIPRVGDKWTLGWGSTDFNGRPVIAGQTCTQQEADDQLVRDMQEAETDVNKLVTVPLTQNEYDALTSLCFNLGYKDFRGSTLLVYLNQRKYAMAGSQILVWNKAGGVIMAGLVRRRKAEFDLYNA